MSLYSGSIPYVTCDYNVECCVPRVKISLHCILIKFRNTFSEMKYNTVQYINRTVENIGASHGMPRESAVRSARDSQRQSGVDSTFHFDNISSCL